MSQDAFQTLLDRGFIQQTTDAAAIADRLKLGPQRIYTGYDPTGDSLHVGHLVTLMALRHLAADGHKPIIILGGGTARVGDPTGKSEMRPVLSGSQIDANVAAITAQIGRFLACDAGQTTVLNNADWLLPLNYIDFLRDIGRHFSVNRMLSFDAYKQRLKRGLSFIEFNYQLLQAYDFYVLHREHGCHFQLGGDDQWGNIVAGVEFCRRMAGSQVEGITVPLLTHANGAKMGKTATGAVWLDPHKLAPYAYYQYWINSEDADVQRFLKIFTFLALPEIASVCKLSGSDLNVAKTILAYEATQIAHGKDAALQVHTAAQSAFGGRLLPTDILPSSSVPRHVVLDQHTMPSHHITANDLQAGLNWCDLLVRMQAVKSKGEARRLIEQGGLRVGDSRIEEAASAVRLVANDAGSVMMRLGKKRAYLLIFAKVAFKPHT